MALAFNACSVLLLSGVRVRRMGLPTALPLRQWNGVVLGIVLCTLLLPPIKMVDGFLFMHLFGFPLLFVMRLVFPTVIWFN